MLQGCWFASFDKNHYCNEPKTIHISLIILGNIYWVQIPNYQFHVSHTWGAIAATRPFPQTNIATISPIIMNSQHSPCCIKMNDVIIQTIKHLKETQYLTKTLHTITHPFILQSARKIPTQYANPWTTIQSVYFILTTTNTPLHGCLNASEE